MKKKEEEIETRYLKEEDELYDQFSKNIRECQGIYQFNKAHIITKLDDYSKEMIMINP